MDGISQHPDYCGTAVFYKKDDRRNCRQDIRLSLSGAPEFMMICRRLSGATGSGNNFVKLAEAVLKQAEKGDSQTVIVE